MVPGLCLALLAGSALAQTSDLLISEYVEGSGDNQAIEIYNGTADVVNLGGYTLQRYLNGVTVPTVITLNSVDLDPGEVFVLVNSLAVSALRALADQTDANLLFSGDDALVLVAGGVPVDSFARVGEDPGSYWSCLEGTTQNHTLRRLPGVCAGDTNINDVFDPCLEWEFRPADTFTGLGVHSDDCGSVPNQGTSWGALKAEFR
jgi:predicted extracellular nuclease